MKTNKFKTSETVDEKLRKLAKKQHLDSIAKALQLHRITHLEDRLRSDGKM
jgi:hypothetical protein